MKYIARKAVAMLVTLLVISLLAFLAFEVLPGDPTTKLLGTDWTPERAELLRAELGLDVPLPLRYVRWLGGFFGGDLGVSYSYGIPVRELLGGRLGITLCLSAMAFLLVLLISLPVSLLLGRMRDSLPGRALTALLNTLTRITMSIPPFFIGIIFTGVFGLLLHLFVAGSFVSAQESLWGFLTYLFFPALSIALPKSAMTVRLLRSSILEQLDEDYVRTAYARGHSQRSALREHVLRNSLIPVITFLAVTIADIVAGSIIVEQVFLVPGLGRMLLLSISNRDYPVVLSIIMMIAAIVIFVNFLADVTYQLVDPRIRLE